MRRLAVLLALWLTGCGQDEPVTAEPPSRAVVQRCLEDRDLQVIGGPGQTSPDDNDAPDRGELITGGAFIAFYSSDVLAQRLSDGVKTNAERIDATVARHGPVTVVYINSESKDEIEDCLENGG